MAKRFTDTDKWKRPWFSNLLTLAKLVWLYILDECDHCGVWHANFRRMSGDLGEPVTPEAFETWFKGKVELIDGDKYFIPSFIEFQQGRLSPAKNAHKPIIAFLERNGFDWSDLSSLKKIPSASHQDGILMPPSKSKGNGNGNGIPEGGAGETKPSLTQAPLEGLFKTWQATLKHFKIERSLSEQEKLEIARAAQKHGAEIVNLALQGARYEAKSDGFDPSQHVSIQRVLKPDRNGMSKLDKFANLGSANQSANKPERVWDPKTKTYVEVSS